MKKITYLKILIILILIIYIMYDDLFSIYEMLDPPAIIKETKLLNSDLQIDDDFVNNEFLGFDQSFNLDGFDLVPPSNRNDRKIIYYNPDLIEDDDSNKGSNVVNIARQFLGTPYIWGGTNPAFGFDCSGLIQYAYKQVGINIPRVSHDIGKTGTEVQLSEVQPGDIIYTSSKGPSGGHVKMVSDVIDGLIFVIEAKGKEDGIIESELTNTSNIKSIRRVLGNNTTRDTNFSSDELFVQTMYNAYRQALKNKGIDENFAPILVAQDVQESGWGKKPVGTYNYGNIVISNKNQSYTQASDGNKYRNFNSLEEYVNYKIDRLNKPRYNFFNTFTPSSNVKVSMQTLANRGYAPGNTTYGSDVSRVYNSILKYLN